MSNICIERWAVNLQAATHGSAGSASPSATPCSAAYAFCVNCEFHTSFEYST